MRRRVHSGFWLIFIMACLIATAFSQSVPPVSFRVAPTYDVGSGPFDPVSVAVGDFNGDGKPDLAVANSSSNNVGVLLGNGDGTFQAAVHYAVGSGPRSVAVGDFNGDGKPDLAVANSDFISGIGSISVLLGNGDGTFQAAVNYASGSGPNSVAVGDFNGDGKLDLAVTTSSSISVLLGNGDGTFQAAVHYAAGSGPVFVAVGDLNGDGKSDLAVANSSSNNVSVLLGDGDGTFQAAVNYAAGSAPRSVAVGDFNGDGKPDLAVANSSSNNVSVLLSNGDGTFQAAGNYAAGSAPRSVAVGDFNGDGKPDLAVANDGSNDVSVLLGNGDGTFQAAVNYNYAAGPGPSSVAVGDFNGDGKPDLAVTNSGYNSSIGVLLGNGDGTFQAAVSYAAGSAPRSMAVGDFNGDGKPDLAVANGSGISVLLGNGDGTFEAAVNYATGSDPHSVAVGDFNGDGKPDLAVANQSSSNVSVLLGNGDGTFQAAVNYAVGGASSVAVGDFNGDGKPDLAVTSPQASFFGVGNVSVLLGNGDGTFQAAGNYAVGSLPVSVVVGDFNGDGKPDLAVANFLSIFSSGISVLLGNGDGTFQAAVNYGAGPNPNALAVGDFNGDGKPDLAVANPDESFNVGNASVLLGNGDGTFRAAAVVAGGNTSSVAVGDFNGDGKPDLAVVRKLNRFDVNVSVLLGNGDGTFRASVNYAAGSNPVFVAVGDFNGDGKPDLAVANSGSNNVTIFLNTTPGSAKAATSITLTSSPNPSMFGQAVTLTATVTPSTGSGISTGTVAFKDGAATIGSATLNQSGQATLSIATLAVGKHTITAIYGGDSGFKDSASSALTQTVNPAATSTGVTSSLNPSTYGQSVTFTAAVTSAAGVPAGPVTFRDGAIILGSEWLNGSGLATFATTALSAGGHSITAEYAGSGIFGASVSPAVSQAVGKAGTATALSSSPNPSTPGQTVNFVATVTGQYGGAVTGTVTFTQGPLKVKRGKNNVLGTASLVNGSATLSLSTLRGGRHRVTAVYDGDVNSKGSTSPTITQDVRGKDRDDDALLVFDRKRKTDSNQIVAHPESIRR
jgi:hypothetical protein